ncbi:MAG: transglutaminase-like domain-containing protein [Candidatus Bathyarchaeia archaeon]
MSGRSEMGKIGLILVVVFFITLTVSNILTYTTLQNQISTLTAEKTSLQSLLNSLETEIYELNSTISSYRSQVSTLESQIATLKSQLAESQSQAFSLGSQLVNMKAKLDKILDIKVTQHYEWVYETSLRLERYQLDLTIPLSLYVEFFERPRPTLRSDWVSMAKDPKDDHCINQVIQQINAIAMRNKFTELEKVNFVASFVQSLPYTADSVSTSWNEYPRYPIETLFDRGGDCEDTSILTAALLDGMGYDVALLVFINESHVAVGVSVEGAYGSYYIYGDKKYYYLETTGEGWKVGQMPSFRDESASIYPLNP